MKFIFLILLTFLHLGNLHGQPADSIVSRVILIGDAGEVHVAQAAVIKHAADNILRHKTNVLFLGDNIYPDGMGLPGSENEEKTKAILRSQFIPMRKNGAAVYFIPGNHDWDYSGKNGLAKIQRQGRFLEEQLDSLLKLIPPNGCPDPIEIKISPELTIIAFDSEWWLNSYAKENPAGNCSCNSEKEILDRFTLLMKRNKDKIILLASHHPFQTYGAHGGYYGVPIFGSIYHAFRKAFPSKQDVNHPLYKEMIRKISSIFESASNVIYVAGHDHGLQYIKSNNIQVVSGSGAKNKAVFKGENSLFADAKPGYVIADLLLNKTLRISFYTQTDGSFQNVFTQIINKNASNQPRSK
ncbi:metallophosphoesterase [Pedobacter immunditicola]|uniref:metallophosphoesterase n=1 Tax=Pedobacter immunditicola TaxID=3133440 RepID=UPI00309D8078